MNYNNLNSYVKEWKNFGVENFVIRRFQYHNKIRLEQEQAARTFPLRYSKEAWGRREKKHKAHPGKAPPA